MSSLKVKVHKLDLLRLSAVVQGKEREPSCNFPHEFDNLGILSFITKALYRNITSKWLEKQRKRADFPHIDYELTLEVVSDRRTLNQNSFYWKLIGMFSHELYGDTSKDSMDMLHEALLQEYAPPEHTRLGINIPMRSSKMSKVQFSHLIEGLFREAMEYGVSNPEFLSMMNEWTNSNEHSIPEALDYIVQDNKEYREQHPVCEACTKGLRYGSDEYNGELAHIIPRSQQFSDETFNLFHFCRQCHQKQHTIGWVPFLELYPHLKGKVDAARDMRAQLRSERN